MRRVSIRKIYYLFRGEYRERNCVFLIALVAKED